MCVFFLLLRWLERSSGLSFFFSYGGLRGVDVDYVKGLEGKKGQISLSILWNFHPTFFFFFFWNFDSLSRSLP